MAVFTCVLSWGEGQGERFLGAPREFNLVCEFTPACFEERMIQVAVSCGADVPYSVSTRLLLGPANMYLKRDVFGHGVTD